MKRQRYRSHGQGTAFQKAPGNWIIRWTESGERRSKYGFRSRDEAEAELNKIKVRLDNGQPGTLPAIQTGSPTLEEYADPFLERRKRTHRAGAEDGYRWRKHMKATFGHLRLPQVTERVIRRFIEDKLQEGLSPGTIRVMVALLSGLFEDLKEQDAAETNPAVGLKKGI